MAENWFRYEQPIEGSSGNIFLFPHAGSSASFFASWKKGTNHKCGFFPVQYPGREYRRKDTISPSIKEHAEAFVKDEKTWYRVIAGSFKDKKLAEQRVKNLSAKGYDGGFVTAFRK